MKRIIFTIIVVIAVNTILAQTYNMKIKQGTGITYSVTTEVDEITFINTTTTPFVCGDVILHGGETYQTVSIGSQCWFQKNLNIGNRISSSSSQEDNSTIEKYCYNNLDANCTTYGGLYQWNEAMQYETAEGSQGICPDGWHIPSYTEFTNLGAGFSYSSKPLKALGQGTAPGDGTNTSGFSALLGGYLSSQLDYSTYFYCNNDANAHYVMLFHNTNIIYQGSVSENSGLSVRCLKD